MKVSQKTIAFLTDTILGDREYDNYKTGNNIVHFFKYMGIYDTSMGFSSRHAYANEKLCALNEQDRIEEAIMQYFNPINFIDNEKILKELVEKANKYFEYEGFNIAIQNKQVKINSIQGTAMLAEKIEKIDNDFIGENLEKCDKKIAEGDYSGAITNARSLLETVLLHLYYEKNGVELDAKGDLLKQYKAVAKLLNLSPESDIEGNFKQILGGLSSVVNGIAGLRNAISDGHGKTNKNYKAEKHHAILVVNSAKTLAEFIYSSYEKQYKKD